MDTKEQAYGNSSFGYHQINWLTYWFYRFLCLFIKLKPATEKKGSPVLITGLFSSGTTITADLVRSMGFDAGPSRHLLRSTDERKHLNPEGFLENYFFMDLSLFIFHKTNSWGDVPPSKTSIEAFSLKNYKRHEPAKFSIIKIHDDRISNNNKVNALLRGNMADPLGYAANYFSSGSFIKNPHICVQLPVFGSLFPSSKIIVVFKHPYDAVESARKISSRTGYDLYNAYYSHAIEKHRAGNKQIIFFSHRDLVSDPLFSIEKLAAALERNGFDPKTIASKIQPVSRLENNKRDVPDNVLEIYNYMLANSVNSKL